MNTAFFHNISNKEHNVLNQEFIKLNNHTYLLSTIDLKFDISSRYSITPLYYETMVFGVGKEQIYYEPMFLLRYSSKDEALNGHENIKDSLNTGKLKMINGFFEFVQE